MAESADARDLKSLGGNFVPVQVWLWAPKAPVARLALRGTRLALGTSVTVSVRLPISVTRGGVAQMVERLNGIQEVVSSILIISTN